LFALVLFFLSRDVASYINLSCKQKVSEIIQTNASLPLTAAGYLEAIESNDRDRIGRYVLLQPNDGNDDNDTDYSAENCFLSHRGPDTKMDLIDPLTEMMQSLYGRAFFVDCVPANMQCRSREVENANVLCRFLWSCPVIVIFLSSGYHESEWCLEELLYGPLSASFGSY
jgi:hypothetical protein